MTDKNQLAKIEDALVKSHRARPEIETVAGWNMRVMVQVRRHGCVWNADRDDVAQRFVWRFAMAVCTLAMFLSLYAFGAGIGTDQLAVSFLFGDPSIALFVM